jgi:hypothetical protein
MLVDFLTGNHLSKVLVRVPWLWQARGHAYFRSEGLGHRYHLRYMYLMLELSACGSRPLVRPGGWFRPGKEVSRAQNQSDSCSGGSLDLHSGARGHVGPECGGAGAEQVEEDLNRCAQALVRR